MKKLLIALLIALPTTVSAAITVPWNATSTDWGFISPTAVNGIIHSVKSPFYVATSTTQASSFPYASTTAASATSLCLSTDCRSSWSSVGSAYPFGITGNATSTLTQFNGGLTSYASSTIGGGGTQNGLTISGNATTTGNSYIVGNLKLGSLTGPLQAVNGLVSASSTIGIPFGGTNATSQVTNGVNYFNGSSITSGSLVTYDGSDVFSISGRLKVASSTSVIIGDVSGNTRGAQSLDIQSQRSNVNQVAGSGSVAVGRLNRPSGSTSIAIGINNIASSTASVSIGNANISSGVLSYAFGLSNNCSGSSAYCIGNGNIVSAGNSGAFGIVNTIVASGSYNFGTSMTNGTESSVQIGTSDTTKLTVLSTGETKALYFTASTTVASTFPYASTTALSASSLTSGKCVQASTGGILTTISIPCMTTGVGTSTNPFMATYYVATSTTATSTFAGGLSVAGSSGLSVLANGNVGINVVAPSGKFTVATTTGSTAFQVSTTGQVQVGNAVPYYGTGANTAIVCYMSDGSLGHITITSLLASGNCVGN